LQPFDMDKALKEEPDYVLFNGSVGANTGDNALQVKVGETVRLYVGNGGPNLVSSFHVIGEIFDKVYIEGGDLINTNIQTTLIPAGGSAIVEFKCDVPGTLNIVDHSIFRTFNKGALAQIKVSGKENKVIYSGKQSDIVYQPEGSAIQHIASAEPVVEKIPVRTKQERIKLVMNLYNANCSSCHMKDGKGLQGAFPPLASSDFLKARADKGINIVLKGLNGKIKVNGKEYDGVMPQMQLTDDEIANILTYIHNNWGNSGAEVTAEEVSKHRNGK
ncbi:MAG: c-type cytochrome, partial [Bacteroidia bacterium]|nr:c-type cytochrome [Bacteroidia bacterium]